jgi:hypothetical protein
MDNERITWSNGYFHLFIATTTSFTCRNADVPGIAPQEVNPASSAAEMWSNSMSAYRNTRYFFFLIKKDF